MVHVLLRPQFARQFIKMKAVLALLVVLGLASCALAGGYGNSGGYGGYGGYGAYYRPALYQQYGYIKPSYVYPTTYGGSDISGGSGGIIIICIIIFFLLAVLAPALIGSLVSSNETLLKSWGIEN